MLVRGEDGIWLGCIRGQAGWRMLSCIPRSLAAISAVPLSASLMRRPTECISDSSTDRLVVESLGTRAVLRRDTQCKRVHEK